MKAHDSTDLLGIGYHTSEMQKWPCHFLDKYFWWLVLLVRRQNPTSHATEGLTCPILPQLMPSPSLFGLCWATCFMVTFWALPHGSAFDFFRSSTHLSFLYKISFFCQEMAPLSTKKLLPVVHVNICSMASDALADKVPMYFFLLQLVNIPVEGTCVFFILHP